MTVISTPGDARSTRSQSVQSAHPPARAPLPIQNWPPSRPFRGDSEQVDQPARQRPPSHQERLRSRSRHRRRRHRRRHDEVPQEVPRPRSAPGLLPPRPRPSIGPTERPASHFRSSDMSPERPPGLWQPRAFSAPSQRPAMPRPRPPPAKSQAEGPLERAAEMFRNPASTSGSSKPTVPSSASVADLHKTTAPKTPPKHPGP